MRSAFAALRTLVLPGGATTGPRIVLDGIGGQILIFDAAGQLYGSITPGGGFQVFDATGRSVRLHVELGPALFLSTGDVDEDVPGFVSVDVAGSGGTRNQVLTISSGSLNDPGAARLQLRSQSADDTEPREFNVDLGNGFNSVLLEEFAGSYAGTTDANGFLVVTHNQDFTPSQVLVQTTAPSGGGNQGYPVLTAKGATTFTIRYLASAGTTASIAVAGDFLCIP